MSNKTSIFKVQMDISHIDQHRYEQKSFTAALNKKENLQHFVMRILAYALIPEQRTEFGSGVCSGHGPDMMVKDYDDHYIYWVDVGFPLPQRIKKASHQADHVVVLSLEHSPWLSECYQELMQIKNVQLLLLDDEMVAQLTQGIQRNINWAMVMDGNRMSICADSHYLESTITRFNSNSPQCCD